MSLTCPRTEKTLLTLLCPWNKILSSRSRMNWWRKDRKMVIARELHWMDKLVELDMSKLSPEVFLKELWQTISLLRSKTFHTALIYSDHLRRRRILSSRGWRLSRRKRLPRIHQRASQRQENSRQIKLICNRPQATHKESPEVSKG